MLDRGSKSKFASETAATDNRVMVAGDIAIRTNFDYYKVVREVVATISFDSYVDVLSSAGSFFLEACEEACWHTLGWQSLQCRYWR